MNSRVRAFNWYAKTMVEVIATISRSNDKNDEPLGEPSEFPEGIVGRGASQGWLQLHEQGSATPWTASRRMNINPFETSTYALAFSPDYSVVLTALSSVGHEVRLPQSAVPGM